jgi:hypothetical protein
MFDRLGREYQVTPNALARNRFLMAALYPLPLGILARAALVAYAVLGVGCGSTASSPPDEIHPAGFPFVVEAGVVSDLCGAPASSCAAGRNPPPGGTTATLTQPELGKLCFKGAVAPGGYAFVVLIFTAYNEEEDKVLTTFNADRLGITQGAFTIDSPPNGGVTIIGAIVKQLDCPGSPNGTGCRTSGFNLMTAPLSQVPQSIKESGPQVAPFANFASLAAIPTATFDTTALDSFAFVVGAGDYDFCIHDFKFLDVAGNEVAPP